MTTKDARREAGLLAVLDACCNLPGRFAETQAWHFLGCPNGSVFARRWRMLQDRGWIAQVGDGPPPEWMVTALGAEAWDKAEKAVAA